MADKRAVFFFDIDNCLYSRGSKVLEAMRDRIEAYVTQNLSVNRDEARTLNDRYMADYGLAIEGLVRHHNVDPLHFNTNVDDAIDLEKLLQPDQELQALLQGVDTTKVKLWLFTNGYINHGQRVVRTLGVQDRFEGITYCDYAASTIRCKPHVEMFEKAMREAGVAQHQDCYFIGTYSRLKLSVTWSHENPEERK